MTDHELPTVVNIGEQTWIREAWLKARPRAVTALAELLGNLVLLFCFLIFYLFLRVLVLAGVTPEDVSFLERADLWAVKAVLITFLVTFVGQSLLGARSTLKSEAQ